MEKNQAPTEAQVKAKIKQTAKYYSALAGELVTVIDFIWPDSIVITASEYVCKRLVREHGGMVTYIVGSRIWIYTNDRAVNRTELIVKYNRIKYLQTKGAA